MADRGAAGEQFATGVDREEVHAALQEQAACSFFLDSTSDSEDGAGLGRPKRQAGGVGGGGARASRGPKARVPWCTDLPVYSVMVCGWPSRIWFIPVGSPDKR